MVAAEAPKWTDVVSAFASTVSALLAIAAAIAAFLAARAAWRTYQVQAADKHKELASKFGLWFDSDTGEVVYINTSVQPVHDVHVVSSRQNPREDDTQSLVMLGTLPPGEDPQVLEEASASVRAQVDEILRAIHEAHHRDEEPVQVGSYGAFTSSMELTVYFVDANGIHWRRAANGTLSEIDEHTRNKALNKAELYVGEEIFEIFEIDGRSNS